MIPPTHDDSTRASLLIRLRSQPSDQSAWEVFVGRYGPQIHAWCRRWGLQEADAEDVTQMVLVRVARVVPGFAYDPVRSFRGWLRTLTRNARHDLLKDRARSSAGPTSGPIDELLQSAIACDDLAARLEKVYDLELLEIAMERVQGRVEPHVWEAFRLTAIDHLSAADAAQRLGLAIKAVYRARSVVQSMLRQEVQSLDPEVPPP